MAYRENYRGEDSQVRRTFECDVCSTQFSMWVARDSAIPDCPICELAARAAITSPPINGTHSKAIDIAPEIAEKDWGMTNLRDNQRKGDTAIVPPSPIQSAERDAMMQQMAEAGMPVNLTPEQQAMQKGFWGSGTPAPTGNPVIDQVLTAATFAAPAGAALARSEGVDPVELLHRAPPKMKLLVQAAAEMSTEA